MWCYFLTKALNYHRSGFEIGEKTQNRTGILLPNVCEFCRVKKSESTGIANLGKYNFVRPQSCF